MKDDDGNEIDVKWIRYRGKVSFVVEDSIYEITKSMREGAESALARVPYHYNPHRDFSGRWEEWNMGHEMAHIPELAKTLATKSCRELAKLVEEVW